MDTPATILTALIDAGAYHYLVEERDLAVELTYVDGPSDDCKNVARSTVVISLDDIGTVVSALLLLRGNMRKDQNRS